jgi:oligoendopeptidase F
MRGRIFHIPLLALLAVSLAGAAPQTRDRKEIPDRYKWNLADIYPTDDAWRAAKADLSKQIPSLEAYRGTLARSPQQLLACLDAVFAAQKTYVRLYSYASMSSDQDTRESRYLGMKQEMAQLGSDIGAKTAFVEPEILEMDRAKVEGFLKAEPKLATYRHYLDDILRRKAHTGTAGEEKIIADAGLMAGAPGEIRDIFSNADFPYPEVTLSDGKTVRLDAAGFSLARQSRDRGDREKVFEAFFGKLDEFRRTFGAQLQAEVQRDMFYARARHYDSSLESALDANAIPVAVYHSLVDNVNAGLPTFHRYLKLRKRILGVPELHYYDLYAPLLPGVDLSYTVDDAEKLVIEAMSPLGSGYQDVLRRAFSERWLDFYPTVGKKSGAYSNGSVYDVHPYMLLNYNGKYEDLTALAHELGHTMQSYYSNEAQPYPTADYPIFVAEVASTLNEALLNDYMLKTVPDDATRLSLLGSYLESVKGTFFRQTQFAEFELMIHEKAEKGEALTGDDLDAMYLQLVRKYYGHDEGVCVVDDDVKAEWAYIPHFFYDFYVYQYATSFTASQALSERVLAGDTAATKRYLAFLAAGGSDYPIELLRQAGVDMTGKEPFELTMKKANRAMDEMEALLAKMGK